LTGTGYAFISAYLKGEESQIVDSEHLSALGKATGYQDAVDSIRDTDLGRFLSGLSISTFDELDQQLWTYFNNCLERITWFKSVPNPAIDVLQAYKVKYDIQNIKTALQNLLTGNKVKGIPAGIVFNHGLLDELVNAAGLDEINRLLSSCNLSEYAAILSQYKTEDGFRNEILTDTTLESRYFSNLISEGDKVKDRTALLKVFYTLIDMVNLQIVLRAVIGETGTDASGKIVAGGYTLSERLLKELLTLKVSDIASRIESPVYRSLTEEIITGYEKDRNISIIDELVDKTKFRIIHEMLAPRNMSPAVLIWYVILKEIEIRNVRLILKAALDNIPSENIRNYLVYSL